MSYSQKLLDSDPDSALRSPPVLPLSKSGHTDPDEVVSDQRTFLSKLKGATIVTKDVHRIDYQQLTEDERDKVHEKKLHVDIVVVKDLVKEFLLDNGKVRVQALKGLNLSHDNEIYPIKKGEFVMIRGPSGGGKTTFLNMLGTIDTPSSGTVNIFGDIIDNTCSDKQLADLRLRSIGFVFQTFNLLSTLSAYENVSLPLIINQGTNKLSQDQIRQRTVQMLGLVNLQDRLNHLPSELSGGEQQRVTIARSLINFPKLLLLDEPTGDLDTRNTIEVMDLLLKINRERKVTCVMVTHNPDLECYADRVLYVEDGVFKKQAINMRQQQLEYDRYMNHLSKLNKINVDW